MVARVRGCVAINTSTGKYAGDLQSNRRTSTIGRHRAGLHGKFIYGQTRTRSRYTSFHIRDSVHIYTCLASTSARDLRKHSRERKTRQNLFSPRIIDPSMKRVKPRDRLFARQINICSSAVSLFAGTISLSGVRTGYICEVQSFHLATNHAHSHAAPHRAAPSSSAPFREYRAEMREHENNINLGEYKLYGCRHEQTRKLSESYFNRSKYYSPSKHVDISRGIHGGRV